MKTPPVAILASLPILSGLLVTLSLPSFDLGLLGWIALVPLLFALRQRGLIAAAVLGWMFGCAFGAGAFSWMNVFPDLNAVRFALMLMLFSVYYLVFGFLYALASRSLGSWMILGAPALWVAVEYARANVSFLSCPWNLLAHSQHQVLPVIQIADFAGAYGVSFLLVMVSQFVSQLLDLRGARRWSWRPQSAALALVLAGTLTYGWHKLSDERPNHHVLRVALVQANVTVRGGMSDKERMTHLAAYGVLTRQAAQHKPDLVVWPSSSLPGPMEYFVIRLYVNHVASRAGAHLLVGGAGGDKFAPPREGQTPYSNSEFLISPVGELEGRYNKVQLTPFTEQVPLHGLVGWPRWLTTLEKSFLPGEGYTLFKVGEARFGAPICWENTFPDLFRRFVLGGANFMVSATNENVFGATAGPYQTLAMNVFRAVENRVAVARAATTGVSAFIDAQGRIVSRIKDERGADLFVRGILTWDVPLAQTRSFYTLHGDVFAMIVTGAAVLIALLSIRWRVYATAAPSQPGTATAILK